MTILNFGSINVDTVFAVSHMVKPGETIAATQVSVNPGGKGANQSVALARAGAYVIHAGCVGQDTKWMIPKLDSMGVDTRHVHVLPSISGGQAMIQVDQNGQNAIVVYGGANQAIPENLIAEALKDTKNGDWLLLQNEINLTARLIRAGHDAGLNICFNPSPFTPTINTFPLDLVTLFVVNEIEGAQLAGLPAGTQPQTLLATLRKTFPQADVCLTLGERGAFYDSPGSPAIHQPAVPVQAVDTTAAGDTFTGFLVAALAEKQSPQQAMELAARAAARAVQQHGAMDSIPRRNEL